ncbi:MAG: hypothetical protein WBG02_14040 [Candidatus Acidiferrum sp.]
MTEVRVQRALNAQKDADAGVATTLPGDVKGEDDTPNQLLHDNERAIAKAEAASDAMGDSLNYELAERKQFWWELGVWGCLTLLASALLAERRDAEDRTTVHK